MCSGFGGVAIRGFQVTGWTGWYNSSNSRECACPGRSGAVGGGGRSRGNEDRRWPTRMRVVHRLRLISSVCINAPEGFGHCVVVAVADRAHLRDQLGSLGAVGEGPGRRIARRDRCEP